MRISLRDALKLPFLIALWALVATLALIFESHLALRFWRAVLLPLAGFAVLFIVVTQMPCEHTIHDAVTRRMPQPEPVMNELPFYEQLTPPRAIGDRFDYSSNPGYQVPIHFDFGADVDWGRIISARLALNARMNAPEDQPFGTEGIWVDGVLSGTPFQRFVNQERVLLDLSRTNSIFFDRLDECCRHRLGWAELWLDELLEGSALTQEDLLADGMLEVVVADDTEIMAAELEICSRVDGWIHCRTAWVSPNESLVQTRALTLR